MGVDSTKSRVPINSCYKFSLLLRWLTFLLGSLTVTLTVLLFWIYFLFLSTDASICSTMAFLPLGNSGHVIVSVSIDFLSNSKQDSPLHPIACDYSRADWDSFCNHLSGNGNGRISLNSVLMLLLVNFVS